MIDARTAGEIILALIAVISILLKRKPANGANGFKDALERIEKKLDAIDERIEEGDRLTRHDIRQDLRGILAEIKDILAELGIIKDRLK